MPLEITEENQYVAQIRLTCDNCKEYIGTRILLQSELEAANKTEHLCVKCKQNRPNSNQQI